MREGAVDEDRIIRGMVGRSLESRFPDHTPDIGEKLFEVKDWTIQHPQVPERLVVKGSSFNVRRGEIVGIAGLMGAGRTELAMSVYGRAYGSNISGRILKDGKPIQVGSVREAIRHGIAYATEDRKRYGLNLIEDIRRNVSAAALSKLATRGWVNANEETKVAEESRRSMNIKAPSVEAHS